MERDIRPEVRSARARYAAALLVITLIGLLLRSWQLGHESPWWDEVASLKWLGAPTLLQFLHLERVDDPAMPPVYFILEYAWSRLLGSSPMAMRFLSLFLGLLALQMMYLVARAMYGARAGLFAALTMALSLVQIYYAQEIRVYALVPLLALVSVYTFIRASEGRRAWLLLHLIANALLAFTHFFTVLLIAAEWLYLVGFRRNDRRTLLLWIAGHVPIALAVLAWIASIDRANVHGVTSWIVKPGVREIGMAFLVFAGGRASNENPASHLPAGFSLDLPLAAMVFLLIAGFIVYSSWYSARQTPQSEALGLSLLWLIFPGMVLCIASYVWRPCFVYRYILYSALPIHILLGSALAAMRPVRLRAACLALLLALYGYQLTALAAGPFRPDWQSVARYLETEVQPTDEILVFQDINLAALEYNSTLPPDQMRCIPVWSEICEPLLKAHDEGRAVWLLVWLWSNPSNIEACFHEHGLNYITHDFKGWPNLRLYQIK